MLQSADPQYWRAWREHAEGSRFPSGRAERNILFEMI